MADSDLYIGLISGTSVDGVDCALIRFDDNQPEIVDTHFLEIDPALKQRILNLCSGNKINLGLLGEVDIEIGCLFASAVNHLLDKSQTASAAIKAIGSHGQTVWHQPEGDHPFTLQIGDPNTIAELTGITTVADFRRRDLTAGGQGAPLAPLLHRNCFASKVTDRVIINIGGISNITVLPADGKCFAFDTGPGNVLMDYWINKNHGRSFDVNGDWARTGTITSELLSRLSAESYLSLPHPKSTGRELFNGEWLEGHLGIAPGISEVDVQATLLEFTATTIVSSVLASLTPEQAFVCGGGAHNSYLIDRLQALLLECTVNTTSKLGIDPDWVEATAFAWMARETLAGRKIDTSPFTGAASPVFLGGIYQA
ncbi:MAG: anhydro-N-acetylmuramic acid kinase [Proteobacteria bacterium]|nr:anhydro-N-acetylmuramic acid kinase [Pseudomonadota bacterium]